jgi:hypothetical protein
MPDIKEIIARLMYCLVKHAASDSFLNWLADRDLTIDEYELVKRWFADQGIDTSKFYT